MSTGKANENKEQIIILYASSVFHQVDKLFNEEKKKRYTEAYILQLK